MPRQPFVMKLFMKNIWNISGRMMMMMMMMMVMVLLMLLRGGEATETDTTTTNATCRHATDMWGDPDPNIFYVCSDGGQPLQLQCPPGRGFFNGQGHLGCLPFAQWPACRPTEEQLAIQLSAGCDSGPEQQQKQQQYPPVPWAAPDPNQFYMCPSAPSATPLLLTCGSGKGFVSTSEVAGCADWLLWRRQLQCEAFY
ncbi:hypothetical protein KR009_000446 [Drosophila setifemur]|nr:hypothetical protein KR009_000446 [Drosophila setifemur]